MKVAIKHDIVLKNGKPKAAIIPYKDFQKIEKLLQSISGKKNNRRTNTLLEEKDLSILKRRQKEKSIPMEDFFKKLENA